MKIKKLHLKKSSVLEMGIDKNGPRILGNNMLILKIANINNILNEQ
jgi:hypothetical protein